MGSARYAEPDIAARTTFEMNAERHQASNFYPAE
jgi:hypothetical protein